MSRKNLGELVPVGGGDAIPLTQEVLSIGRRESCDLCLKFQNISSQHCELAYANGTWTIKDLKSSNGVKVNGGERLSPHSPRVLRPGDEISVASHKFVIHYEAAANIEDLMVQEEDLFSRSLMEKAGLEKPKKRA